MIRTAVLVALTSLLLVPSPTPAQTKSKESVFDKVLHSCAFIVAPLPDRKRVSTGTGSYVGTSPKKNPVIITNYHVIAPAVAEGRDREVRVMFPVKNSQGELVQDRSRYQESINDPSYVFRGKVLAYTKSKDLALVELFVDKTIGQQLPKGIYPIPLAAGSPKPSTAVHTVGNTGAGSMWSYTPGNVRGVVNKKMRSRNKAGDDDELMIEAKVIETTNSTNPGDSGGPLVNDDAELVGVTQGGMIDANNIAIFIDINEVKALLREHKIEVPRRTTTLAKVDTSKTEAEGDLPKAAPKAEPKRTDPREAAAESKLRNARRAIKDKDYQLAEEFLKDLLNLYEDSKAAAEAKTLLEEVRKKK